MTDADQQIVPGGATYHDYVPVKPVHAGPKPKYLRVYMYYDWHVAPLKRAN
jgi:hypothetical protein